MPPPPPPPYARAFFAVTTVYSKVQVHGADINNLPLNFRHEFNKRMALIAGQSTNPGDVEIVLVSSGSVVVDSIVYFATLPPAETFAASLTCCVNDLFLQSDALRLFGPFSTLSTRRTNFTAPPPALDPAFPPPNAIVSDPTPPVSMLEDIPSGDVTEESLWTKTWFVVVVLSVMVAGLLLGMFVSWRVRRHRVLDEFMLDEDQRRLKESTRKPAGTKEAQRETRSPLPQLGSSKDLGKAQAVSESAHTQDVVQSDESCPVMKDRMELPSRQGALPPIEVMKPDSSQLGPGITKTPASLNLSSH